MHKFMVALLVGMFSIAAFGQEMETNAPKAEFFGGYQYTRFDGGTNANGWNMAANSNFNNWLGIAGDFSGAYAKPSGVSLNTYTYTFGPVVAYRHNEKVTPFAHFLLGGFHQSASVSGASVSASGFAMMFGGGFDVKATRHVALRAFQFDWLSLHANSTSDNNNMRISTGLLFRY